MKSVMLLEHTYIIWYKQVEETILNLSQEEFAGIFHVEQATISRNEDGEAEPSQKFIEEVYNYAFEKSIQLNRLKEMLWRDNLKENEKLIFHGAKIRLLGI